MSKRDLKQIYYERSMVYLEQVLLRNYLEPWIPKIADHMAEVQLYVNTLEHKIEKMKEKK